MNLFDHENFTGTALTTRANDAELFPFVESQLAAFFETDSVRTDTVQADREKFGSALLPGVARGTTAGSVASSRSRQTKPVNGFKIGDKIELTPAEIAGIRQTGLVNGEQVALETYQSKLDKRLAEKAANMDKTQEFLRFTTLRGVTKFPLQGGGFDELDWRAVWGLPAAPAPVELKLDEASPKSGALRTRFTGMKRTTRDNMGGRNPTGYRALYGKNAWDLFVEHKEVREGFARQDSGAYLTADGFEAVRFNGIEHMEYRGEGIGDDEVLLFPTSVTGMLSTIFTTGDKFPFVGEEGLPRFVVPRNADNPFSDFGEGAQWEISSIPAYINLWPEAVVSAVGTTNPAP